MNASQSNKLNMYQTVQALLGQVPSTSVPALPAKLAALGNHIAAITVLANTQTLPTKGRLVERELALADMVESSLAIAGPALSYAETNQLTDLAAKLRIWPSHFTALRRVQRPLLAQRIYDAALPHTADLFPFGVTEAMLGELHANIAAATVLLAQPRGVAVEKQIATGQLAAEFIAADQLLDTQIDPLVWALRKNDPTSYARYQVARQVIDRAGGRPSQEPALPAAAHPAVVSTLPVPAPALPAPQKLAA